MTYGPLVACPIVRPAMKPVYPRSSSTALYLACVPLRSRWGQRGDSRPGCRDTTAGRLPSRLRAESYPKTELCWLRPRLFGRLMNGNLTPLLSSPQMHRNAGKIASAWMSRRFMFSPNPLPHSHHQRSRVSAEAPKCGTFVSRSSLMRRASRRSVACPRSHPRRN
jgi:hypothetical protein